jgi:hypothetical protein
VVASLFLEQEERKLLSSRYQAAGAYRSKCSKDLEGVAKRTGSLRHRPTVRRRLLTAGRDRRLS